MRMKLFLSAAPVGAGGRRVPLSRARPAAADRPYSFLGKLSAAPSGAARLDRRSRAATGRRCARCSGQSVAQTFAYGD